VVVLRLTGPISIDIVSISLGRLTIITVDDTITRSIFLALALLLSASWTVARAANETSTETKTTKKS